MAEDEDRRALTPAESAASAKALGDIIDTALAREAKARAQSNGARQPAGGTKRRDARTCPVLPRRDCSVSPQWGRPWSNIDCVSIQGGLA
jgi:hypothetical protein